MEEQKDYTEFHHCLTQIKTKLEQVNYNESKYFLKNLVPFLIGVFENIINIPNDAQVIYAIKVSILEIFSKVMWENDLIDTCQAVLNFIPKILEREIEDLGIKALKIFLEYYKNMKQSLGWGPVDKFVEFTINMYKNFESIVNENYAIICSDRVTDRNFQLMANKSFKVINEIPLILMLTYNLFTSDLAPIIQRNISTIVSVLKVLRVNPYKDNESNANKKIQISLYEDYLYTLTKLEYMIAFLIKINETVYESLFSQFGEDIVIAIKHVLDNTPKDNIHTRKEILSIAKNLIKPFAKVFYNHNQYFRNEDNLLGKSAISYDFIVYEVNKITFTLVESIYTLMQPDEKATLIEELVMKINNYRIGYESKVFIFYYINLIMDSMKSFPQDAGMKMRLIALNNSILEELAKFFDQLSKIITGLDTYYQFNTGEKTNKWEYLDRNFFDPDENLAMKSPDIHSIQQSNINHVFELILNNEYEKYINPDEMKFVIDLLKHSNVLLKLCTQYIQFEHASSQSIGIPITGTVQVNMGNIQAITNEGRYMQMQTPKANDSISLNSSAYKKAYYLRKIFCGSFNICEKLFKSHIHSSPDDGNGKLHEIQLVNIYLGLPPNICCAVFQQLMPFIFQLILYNSKVCPMKNCILSIIIDTIFEMNNMTAMDQTQILLRKELFDIVLDYFTSKIHYIGNNLETYDENYQYSSVSMSVLINIFKSLFKYLLNFATEDKTKLKVTNFLVNCLILTKSSKFFGNYIYVIRCLFKNLLNMSSHSSSQQFEFYKETIHFVYGIMKFMISIKDDFPFLKEMLTEIIMIFPIKFKYMIDYAKIVFPSLIDALNMNQEIIPVGLQYLEQWMNALFHKPENVKPFLQNNINLLTTLLTSHLYKNYAISLNSLKLLSKFGGRSRNYLEDKLINPKTSPTNILVIDLKDNSLGKGIEFPIDNIVDLCIKIVTNYKRHSEKNWLSQIKTSFKSLKACFLTFIGEEIDEKFIQNVKDSILKNSEPPNEAIYEQRGYFKKFNFSEEQAKINVIYRKAEHFLVEKLLRGLFLCCTIPEIEEEIKDFVKFVCDYFVMIMIAKDKNNKHIHVFEIDPTIILDIICEFLFSNNPTVFKNNNQTCISIAMKLINMMIDTIENFFDKDYKVIQNLEIVEIIYMKFLNACYNNEWAKKGGGLVTLLILIKRFSKDITFKYIRHIIRAVLLVANNYSSIVKIKYEGDCEQILSELASLFTTHKESYDKLTRGMLIADVGMAVELNDELEFAKKDFKQMFDSLGFFQDELLNNIHSISQYAMKISRSAYANIMKNKHLKNIPSLFMLIEKVDFVGFFKFYYSEIKGKSTSEITLTQFSLTKSESSAGMLNETENDISTYYSSSGENSRSYLGIHENLLNSKLSKKLQLLMTSLSKRLELNSDQFLPMISNCTAFHFLIKQNHAYFLEYILYSKLRFEDYLKVIKNVLDILVTDMFLYLEITKKIHESMFNSKFKYFFIEKFYSTKQLHLTLSVKVGDNIIEFEQDMPPDLEDVMKYIFQNYHTYIFDQYFQTNNNYTSVDPYIQEIFPILSNKMKMLKSFIKLLKYVFSDKALHSLMKIKLDNQVIDKNSVERYNDLKNKCTNLIFRLIIYREEKLILKVSKKYIRTLLKVESSTRHLLPEEELKKCIKPMLEQIANNRVISFKLIESLAILIKLLSTNFNQTLGDKLKASIETIMNGQENISSDNSLVHAILSLFAYLKPVQIKDLFQDIFDIILKLERDAFNKRAYYTIFNSKYKLKIIKFLSNFSESLCKFFFDKINSMSADFQLFIFLKKLLREEGSYVIRETFARVFHANLLERMIRKDISELEYPVYKNFFRVFAILCKKSPGILNMEPKLIVSMNEFFESKLMNLYTDPMNEEKDRELDMILKCIARLDIFYLKAFDKNNFILHNILFYKKKTRITRAKEKIKLFFFKTLSSRITAKRMRNITLAFLNDYTKIAQMNYLDEVIKYLILPMIIRHIKEKLLDETVEVHFVKNLSVLIFNEENRKRYDDCTNLEIIKLIIILIAHFLNPNKELLSREDSHATLTHMLNFLTLKFASLAHALTLYSCLGLSLISLLIHRQGDRMLHSLNVFFFKQNQYDHLNIINLCFEMIIPYCMSKQEESPIVIKNLKLFLNDRAINISQFFHIFSLVLKFPDLFVVHKLHLSNIVIQFILKSISQHNNATTQQKKLIVQLLGLIIYWFKNEKFDKNDDRFSQVERLKENTLLLLTKYYKLILVNPGNDADTLDIARKYLIYIKEVMKISDFSIKKFFLIESEHAPNSKVFFQAYLYLLKIAILYSKKDTVLQNIDYFLKMLKQLNDPSFNIRSTNDAALIIKCIINDKIFTKLNEHPDPISDDIKLQSEFQLIQFIKELFEHSSNMISKKKGKLIADLEFKNIVTQDIKASDIMKDILNNVKGKVHVSSPEKLFELFPHIEYRYYSIFYFYITENSITPEQFPHNKENIESVLKLCEGLTRSYFENWYIFTLLVMQIFKEDEERMKRGLLDPESDYFTSNSSFLTNLKTVENLEKIKSEKNPKLILNDNPKKNYLYEIIIETIFIGVYIVINNQMLMSMYKSHVMKVLLLLVDNLQNTNVSTILEHMITISLKCKYNSSSELNKFLYEMLKVYDYANKKISANLLTIAIEYLEAYVKEYDSNIRNVIKILLYASRFHDYNIRKRIFKLYEKFNGTGIVNKLKWIFQVDSKTPDIDNNSWLPFSVDMLLQHFQTKDKILRKDYSSKLRKLNNSKCSDNTCSGMEVDDEVKVDNGMITMTPLPMDIECQCSISNFPWIESYNKEISTLKMKSLLIPIRDIVLGDISISQKMWFSIFPQVWRILSKDDQEFMSVYINDFFMYLTNLPSSQKGPLIVKAMLESIANCYPLIRVSPEVLYVLAKNHNSWNAASFYLEKMLTSNIEKERSYCSLTKILETLKEEDHVFGIKRYVTDNRATSLGLSFLQCSQYSKAEDIFVKAFNTYKDQLDKIELSFSEGEESITLVNEFPNKIDFSIWEQGIIDCYRNTNKWGCLNTFAEETNNIEIKIESLWHLGKWQEIEAMSMHKFHYLAKINQIYMMMKQEMNRGDNTYQQKCMECIRTIFQDFSTFPPNFEKLNYYFFLIFQLIVEAWESTNTLKEIERNINEKKTSDFRENLIMWRDRIPHVCEGFYSLKSILDPRNYLFEILRDLIKTHYSATMNTQTIASFFPNISDHIWNDMIFLKYARKLNLTDVYNEYYEKFNRDIQNLEKIYPIENYLKNLEHFKFIRNKNNAKGLELADELLKNVCVGATSSMQGSVGAGAGVGVDNTSREIENEIKASYLSQKGYFSFKLGKVLEAHECFREASTLNSTNYSIYRDWGEMSESILFTVKGDSRQEATWFENTVINYLLTIVFKLDKAKYIIPKIFLILKRFPNQRSDMKFERHLDNIPTWVWLFWIPQILECLKPLIHRNFFLFILKKLAKAYPQAVYYPLTIFMDESQGEIKQKCEEMKASILDNDKHYQIFAKIDLIMNEIKEKVDLSMEEIILNHLLNYLDIQSARNVNDAIDKISRYLNKLKTTDIKLDYIDSIFQDFPALISKRDTTIFSLYEKIKTWRYFIQSKLATESNFKDLSLILSNKLYNSNFDGVEVPGYFSNKIMEPTSENKVYIMRFESEYSFKLINFSHKKLIIRGSNEKLFHFSIIFEKFKENSDLKILQLQTLLNHIFSSNQDTFKSNVKFIIPIKYSITTLMKITQEETNQYSMNEVFEFCMQKFGYDPEIAYSLYEEEAKKSTNQVVNYYNYEIISRVYTKMCDLVHAYNLKNFIHKFIINCDEIFIFRKQFATSYAVNNLLVCLLKVQDRAVLNKISFNKETGSVTFHDIKYHHTDDYLKFASTKRDFVQFRISKNINYFLSPACLYGVMPGAMHAATNALCEKSSYVNSIIFTTLSNNEVKPGDDENQSLSLSLDCTEKIMSQITLINNKVDDPSEHPLKVLLEMINMSMTDENLSKMPISWNPWF